MLAPKMSSSSALQLLVLLAFHYNGLSMVNVNALKSLKRELVEIDPHGGWTQGRIESGARVEVMRRGDRGVVDSSPIHHGSSGDLITTSTNSAGDRNTAVEKKVEKVERSDVDKDKVGLMDKTGEDNNPKKQVTGDQEAVVLLKPSSFAFENENQGKSKVFPNLKVLSANMYWWKAFGEKKHQKEWGWEHMMARLWWQGAKNEADTQEEPWDLMGFQECGDGNMGTNNLQDAFVWGK